MTTATNRRLEAARELASLLRELADACEPAASGDRRAKDLLNEHTDGYWHGLCVGSDHLPVMFGVDDE